MKEKVKKFQEVCLKMNKLIFSLLLFSTSVFAQSTKEGGVDFFTDVLGKKGLLFAIGAIFFTFAYRNSVKLFAWLKSYRVCWLKLQKIKTKLT